MLLMPEPPERGAAPTIDFHASDRDPGGDRRGLPNRVRPSLMRVSGTTLRRPADNARRQPSIARIERTMVSGAFATSMTIARSSAAGLSSRAS